MLAPIKPTQRWFRSATRGWLLLGLTVVSLSSGCKRKQPVSGVAAKVEVSAAAPGVAVVGAGASSAAVGGNAGGVGAGQPEVRWEVGVQEPLMRMSAATAKSLQRGYKALNAKRWEECAAAFSEVAAAMPDYLDARYYQARALVMQEKYAEARAAAEALIQRNYVAYVRRIEGEKEFAGLRGSAEWAAYQRTAVQLQSAYLQGLSGGVVLVMRLASAKPMSYQAVSSSAPALREAKLELQQEVLHFDPETGRYRQLTATGGRVLAAQRSADGKTLVLALAERAQHNAGKLWFVDPQFAFLDLATLEVAGPVAMKGSVPQITIGFSKGGVPLLAAAEALEAPIATYQLDSARIGLVKVPEEQGLFGERTEVWVDDLQHSERRVPADVTPALDLHSFSVGPAGAVVTSAQKLEGSSFVWSPAHKQLLYAGAFDACAALDKRKESAQDKNGLYLYDLDKKTAQRLEAARSTYETLWLSEDWLAYETGINADSRVQVRNVKTGKSIVLSTRYGGGLYGVSAHKCDEPLATTDSEAAALPPPPPSEEEN